MREWKIKKTEVEAVHRFPQNISHLPERKPRHQRLSRPGWRWNVCPSLHGDLEKLYNLSFLQLSLPEGTDYLRSAGSLWNFTDSLPQRRKLRFPGLDWKHTWSARVHDHSGLRQMCLVEKLVRRFYMPLHLDGNKATHSKGFENRGITGYDCLAFRHVIFSERHLRQIRGKTCLFDAVKKKKSQHLFLHVKTSDSLHGIAD